MKKQDEVIAYKAFFKGLKNNIDGITYQIDKEYVTKDRLQYMQGGFHMCEKPEDCFRFLRPTEAEVELTLVKGYGNLYGFDAGYRAYDDSIGYIFICEKMKILKVFTREEIFDMALHMNPTRLKIFLSLYPLTFIEAETLKDKYLSERKELCINERIPKVVDYYQKKYKKRKENQYE